MARTNDLPPAGYKRNEELKQRTDALEEQAEALEVEAIDPSAFEKIREIQYAIMKGAVNVSDADPNYRYCWVGTHIHGQAIWQKKALGWEVVQGSCKEAMEYKDADTTRRIGDTMLMRIPEERAKELDMYASYLRDRQVVSVESELMELGDKYRSKGLIVHSGDSDRVQSSLPKMAARSIAAGKVDSMLRKGNVPGLGGAA